MSWFPWFARFAWLPWFPWFARFPWSEPPKFQMFLFYFLFLFKQPAPQQCGMCGASGSISARARGWSRPLTRRSCCGGFTAQRRTCGGRSRNKNKTKRITKEKWGGCFPPHFSFVIRFVLFLVFSSFACVCVARHCLHEIYYTFIKQGHGESRRVLR